MSASKNVAKPLPPLEEVIAWEFDDIAHHFIESWDMPLADAQELFIETKKWVWLMAARYHDRKAGLPTPKIRFTGSTYMLDQMWHQFMLYTPNYEKFTRGCFGFFIGHAPSAEEDKRIDKETNAADPEGERKKLLEELKGLYAFVREKLGAETEERWYTTWATKYSQERLNAIRKPIVLHDY